MSVIVPSDPVEQADVLRKASQLIEQTTTQFPISQIVVPLADTFDWLLDDVSTKDRWREQRQSFEREFTQRWQNVSERALKQNSRQVSDRALKEADYDPLDGAQPWGIELTRVFRAALAEIGPLSDKEASVLPNDERTRAFTRAMRTQDSSFILPVISYAPLLGIEWRVILEKLEDLIELSLVFEGAVAVWLIGGFARDVEGKLRLRPQLSFVPPQSGTRIRPIRVLLGTAYEEQCPALLPLVRAMRDAKPRPSDSLLMDTLWHRVVVQLDVTTEDYELLNLNRLSDVEMEIARQIMYLEQQPREPQVLEGAVHEVPRPWRRLERALEKPASLPPVSETRILPPRPALQAASQPPVAAIAEQPSTVESLHQDAEELRGKGMAAIAIDPAIAQKYLLASTVLENTSVDVWLTLVDIAPGEKQKESFRREAEKVLRRQHRNQL